MATDLTPRQELAALGIALGTVEALVAWSHRAWADLTVSALVGRGDAIAAKLADECTCGQCKSCTTLALWDKAREGHRR